jgi:hypothetical protein
MSLRITSLLLIVGYIYCGSLGKDNEEEKERDK